MTLELTLQERADHYHAMFPNYPRLLVDKGFLMGNWLIGNWYKKDNDYYGSYPHNFIHRMRALFPDTEKEMHLFSGTIKEAPPYRLTYDVIDTYHPTIQDDVRNIGLHGDVFSKVDIVYADPPYLAGDFKKYGVKPFSKAKAIRDLGSVMRGGTFLCWLDNIYPMFNKDTWHLVGTIEVRVGTNTRIRGLTIFRRVGGDEGESYAEQY